MAKRFALVTLTPENVIRLKEIVERHGLESRVSGIYSLEPRTDERELSLAFAEPAKLVETFTRSVERAVADGAELVIAAEGVMNEVLFAHGITRIGDIPVLDCIGNVILHAEMMINLKRRTGLSIGRRWEHAKPDATMLAALRKGSGLE
jgi:Asp/Glu/hydantoin racemase